MEKVLLVGNGPSAGLHDLVSVRARVGEHDRIARMNHFYVGENFGRHADDLFFAVDEPSLIANLYGVLSSGQRTVSRLVTPLSRQKLGPLSFLDVEVVHPWARFPTSDFFNSIYIRGSREHLPTTGLQALHFYLTVGVRRFTAVGLDFYSSPVRYAHIDEVKKHRIGHHHLDGYEANAHSLQDDMNYLLHLGREFEFSVDVLSAPTPWIMFRDMAERMGIRGAEFNILNELEVQG